MTVKKREAGIVCHEVGLDPAEWIDKHNILDDARRDESPRKRDSHFSRKVDGKIVRTRNS